jgi:hypothetical protein
VQSAVSNGVASFLHQFVELVKDLFLHLEQYSTVCRKLHKIPRYDKKLEKVVSGISAELWRV